MNEEDVKNKIVVPYFQELGFELSNMDFERGFTIYLGHHKLPIGKDKDPHGRLDILVKYNSQNLFVIEKKDKIQAISYASLLDQIAPFAIVRGFMMLLGEKILQARGLKIVNTQKMATQ